MHLQLKAKNELKRELDQNIAVKRAEAELEQLKTGLEELRRRQGTHGDAVALHREQVRGGA